MSKRPSFQFYAGDWLRNAKLRRCSHAARGAWIDVICLLHDSDEYGVLRWPLADIAQAIGASSKLLKELHEKGVLKGGDKSVEAYTYRPTHARKEGREAVLIEAGAGPCWYCSRLVRDEHIRSVKGSSGRFGSDADPAPMPPIGERQGDAPNPAPMPPIGERQGDGLTVQEQKQEQEQDQKPSSNIRTLGVLTRGSGIREGGAA